MTPTEIHTLFSEALDLFEPVSGQTTDANIQLICESITPILLFIPYDDNGGKETIVGLIMADAKYTDLYGQSFVRPKRLAAYDASINIDTKNADHVRAEATHKAHIDNHNVYVAAECNTCKFILKKAEDMWVRELREPDTFHKMFKATNLLNHLQAICGGLHALDVLMMQNEMQCFHLEAEGIPEYINAIEDAQKASKRALNTITDATLLVISTSDMLENVAFPQANNEWEDLPKTYRT